MKQNSLKSLKVVARFFSYVSAGHEASVSDEGSGGKSTSTYHPDLRAKGIKFTKSENGWLFLFALPLVVLYGPPLRVRAVKQAVLLIFP